MKKPKISLDSGKIKSLFVRHVEKVLLVLVLGMMLFLVYQGFSLPGLEPGKTPQGLLQTSTEMMQFIDNDQRWNEVKSERQRDLNVSQDVEKDRQKVDPAQYFLVNRLEVPNFPKLSPRTDPKLFPPMHLVVVPKRGPLAYLKLPTDVDQLMPIPDEEGADEAKPKPKAKPKAKAPKLNPMGPGGMAMPGGGPAGAGAGGKKAKRGKGEDLVAGEGFNSSIDDVVGMDFGGAGVEGGMGGGGVQRGGINPESVRGFEAPSGATAKDVQAVVVMAVVQFEKQVEEYLNSLANSLDYDSDRDSPLYLQYYVQRADVTGDPSVDPAALPPEAWENVGVNAAMEETYNWAGSLQEIVAPEMVDAKLTHPAPPFMQRDLWDLLNHPDIPLSSVAASEAADTGNVRRPVTGPKTTPTDDAPTIDSVGPPQRSGGGGFGETPGMPAGGAPSRGGGGAVVGPRSGGGGMTGAGMPAGGGPGMGGEGMGMGFGAGSGIAGAPPPKYKLIRFTDMTVEAGHKYRYRMRVLLHDPNNPTTGYTPPSPASLAAAVRARIKAQDPKIFYVFSEWSEASPIAELPATNLFFAGSVKQPDTTPIVAGKPEVPNAIHPVGKALAVVWDPTKVVDVPAEVAVHRGSILNFVRDAKVIHPVTHEVVDLAAYPFATNAIVADLMGGREIPLLDKQSKKPPLVAPGELLIFDASGNLHVQHETDDIDSFRRYLVPDAPEAAATTSPMGEGGFGGILEGMPAPGGAQPVRPKR